MNILASILKYPSVAAVQMVERHGGDSPPACVADPSSPAVEQRRQSPAEASADSEYNRGVRARVVKDWAAAVDAFHRAALAAGGRDNGAPGPRLEYSPGYYGAFVLDPDGHNIEAVFHPEP